MSVAESGRAICIERSVAALAKPASHQRLNGYIVRSRVRAALRAAEERSAGPLVRAARLGQADRDGLFGGSRAVLAFADVVHFLADKFTGLGRWGLAFAFIPGGAFERFFLGHDDSPNFGVQQPCDFHHRAAIEPAR